MEGENKNREDSKVVVLLHSAINKSSILSGVIPAGLERNTSTTTALDSLAITKSRNSPTSSNNRSGVCWASKNCEVHKKCKEAEGKNVNREDSKVLVLHHCTIIKSSFCHNPATSNQNLIFIPAIPAG